MAHILAGLDPEAYDRTYSDLQLLRRIGIYFLPQYRRALIGVSVILISAGLNVLLLVLTSDGIDSLLGNQTLASIILLFVAILALGIAAWVCDLIQQWQMTRLIANSILDIRRDSFNAVMGHDMSFFDARSTGELVSRMAVDTSAFGSALQMTVNVIGQVVLIILLTIVLFMTNVILASITIAIALFISLITLGFRRSVRHLARQQKRTQARLNSTIEETISGIVIAKNFRQERAIYGDLTQTNHQWYAATLRMNVVETSIFPFLTLCTGLGTVAIVFFGGQALQGGQVSLGQWYLFLQGVLMFWWPFTSLASFWSQFQQGLAAGERVFSLMDTPSQVVQTDQQLMSSLTGRIEFREVKLQYSNRETVLEDFSLTIQPGETIALVGHTGGGKTSIIRLIARLYEFQAGELLIDGRDIRTLDLEAYRRHIGMVPQTPFLFSGTIADNIRYARPKASDEEVLAAAHAIAQGDWLTMLPQGIHTPVGERGRALSTGQRQFVALARVMLQNPSIIILDEATASIDPMSEALLQEGLSTLLQGRTAIVVAHRLPTIRKADRIIVIERGKILEQGTHEALLDREGAYANLYRLYFQHQLPDYEVHNAHA